MCTPAGLADSMSLNAIANPSARELIRSLDGAMPRPTTARRQLRRVGVLKVRDS
jgi:hypothetical protein